MFSIPRRHHFTKLRLARVVHHPLEIDTNLHIPKEKEEYISMKTKTYSMENMRV
jgi:hypothetical protein